MLVSLLLLLLIASAGMMLTYLIADDEPLLWRLAAGCVAGSAVFGIAAFAISYAVGFSAVSVVAALAVTSALFFLIRYRDTAKRFKHDRDKAKGRLDGANLRKALGFIYYAFFFLLFWFFFGQTVYQTSEGIFTGGSQNLGDLPYHIGAILGFSEAAKFPPDNPIWAGAKYAYPFITDFISACFVKLGVSYRDAIVTQNVLWTFSLFVLLERFVARVTANKLAGRIAPALLFLSGGLGFLWFLGDVDTSGKGIISVLSALPRDYTIGEQFRWGNSLVVLFITQRSMLLGLPLVVLVLGVLWKIFIGENVKEGKSEKGPFADFFTFSQFPFSTFTVGLLAGTLPLIHLHSLAVLFIVTAFLFVLRPARWVEWITFGVGVAIVAVPLLAWTMTGSASDTTSFFGWEFGWDKRNDNFFWFWFKNTSLTIPLLLAGLALWYWGSGKIASGEPDKKTKSATATPVDPVPLLLFYIPFAFLFVLGNTAKLAPWVWDNIKILIYWHIGSIIFISFAIAWLWQKAAVTKVIAVILLVSLTFAGGLDVWRTTAGTVKTRVFEPDAVRVADQIRQKTENTALFLNAPIYNTPIVLTGRQSLMRYTGHLFSHGINAFAREADVKRIYEGGGVSEMLLRQYNIDYVLVSPEEKNTLKANEEFFKKYPLVAEAGQYRVYKVK
ncbi:MAG: hypothetical protein IPM59_05335 [Chloracidobacterium sp.]|nr:hypothetical protein [Chloracidobacterium sp.]